MLGLTEELDAGIADGWLLWCTVQVSPTNKMINWCEFSVTTNLLYKVLMVLKCFSARRFALAIKR